VIWLAPIITGISFIINQSITSSIGSKSTQEGFLGKDEKNFIKK